MRNKDITTSKRWRAKREKILRRDGYIDQYLLSREGKCKQATIVHHILPKEIYPEFTYEDWNLISVSMDTHTRILHQHYTGELTKKGEQLMLETAFKNNIKLNEVILVIGLPNSGKTTWVQQNIGSGLAYDLDYIAGAFRLKKPKGDNHEGARTMANRLLKGFINEANKYARQIFVIRTAPYDKELYEIKPDKIIYCDRHTPISNTDIDIDYTEYQHRIDFILEYAKRNEIELVRYSPPTSKIVEKVDR